MFDTLLTMASEVEYIWSSRPSLVVALYLLSRYTAFADVALVWYCESAIINIAQ